MDSRALYEHRAAKDDFFRTSPQSPLGREEQDRFAGLEYFEARPDLAFTVPLQRGDGAEIRIPTSDSREKLYRRVGKVGLQVDGSAVELTVYDTGHPGYFVPFRDATSGESTYGAGRYLDIEPDDDGTLTVDFNYAYNPYCVYSDGYSCPLPPAENWLQVPIEAGEKMYERGGIIG